MLEAAANDGLIVEWLLETHPHADHLSAAAYLRARTGAKIAVGAGIRDVQRRFAALLAADDVQAGGRDFDLLLNDGHVIELGALAIQVLATPGHTPACVTYVIGDSAFVGDTLFMPDYGTARTDFPGGDARQLYRSIHRILNLPRQTRLFLCHDYKAPGRDQFAWETSIGEQLDDNIHVGAGVDEDSYVAMRTARDATLKPPKLLYPAIQVNIRGGRLPPPRKNGRSYIQLPLTIPPGTF
jgi:glyoxylase-like metal-dependent hydrolase (beta-lactamase superfamily II)